MLEYQLFSLYYDPREHRQFVFSRTNPVLLLLIF